MKNIARYSLLALLICGTAFGAVPEFRYAARTENTPVWRADAKNSTYTQTLSLTKSGNYNLYLDVYTPERKNYQLLVNGEEVPSLALPRTGTQPDQARRIKTAAGVKLKSGENNIEYRFQSDNKPLIINGLMAEDTTRPFGWQLVWEDQFNEGSSPAEKNWRGEEGFLRNREVQYYTMNRPENIRVANGMLTITARRENWKNSMYQADSDDWRFNTPSAEFTSAEIDTYGKHAWQYGKIEARLKVTGGSGSWPAFWTMGENGPVDGWPAQGEIDIMEFFGKSNNRITQAAHFYSDKTGGHVAHQDWNIKTRDQTPIEDTFHVYSVIWDENKIEWFIDGAKTFEHVRDKEDRWCFESPQYIILNYAMGSHSGPVPAEFSSWDYVIDYVRVYQ